MRDRVIILEDAAGEPSALRDEVQRCGFKTRSVNSKQDYLASVRNAYTTLVVMDVFMHSADAIRLLRATRQVRPRLPVVVVMQDARGARQAIAMTDHAADETDIESVDAHRVAVQIQAGLDSTLVLETVNPKN